MQKIILLVIMLLASIANACEPAIDLEVNENITPTNNNPSLIVFVSLGMPKHSLQQWNLQVTKAGGVLVLRGFVNNSMKQTVKKITEVLGKEPQGGFSIDPEKFKQFNIKVVPTVLVASNDNSFDKVSGDVSLTYALEKIVADGEHGKVAEVWLKKLQGLL